MTVTGVEDDDKEDGDIEDDDIEDDDIEDDDRRCTSEVIGDITPRQELTKISEFQHKRFRS